MWSLKSCFKVRVHWCFDRFPWPSGALPSPSLCKLALCLGPPSAPEQAGSVPGDQPKVEPRVSSWMSMHLALVIRMAFWISQDALLLLNGLIPQRDSPSFCLGSALSIWTVILCHRLWRLLISRFPSPSSELGGAEVPVAAPQVAPGRLEQTPVVSCERDLLCPLDPGKQSHPGSWGCYPRKTTCALRPRPAAALPQWVARQQNRNFPTRPRSSFPSSAPGFYRLLWLLVRVFTKWFWQFLLVFQGLCQRWGVGVGWELRASCWATLQMSFLMMTSSLEWKSKFF